MLNINTNPEVERSQQQANNVEMSESETELALNINTSPDEVRSQQQANNVERSENELLSEVLLSESEEDQSEVQKSRQKIIETLEDIVGVDNSDAESQNCDAENDDNIIPVRDNNSINLN